MKRTAVVSLPETKTRTRPDRINARVEPITTHSQLPLHRFCWGAGKGNFSGIWPLVWHHLVDTPSSKKYVDTFQKKYGKLPDNQSWGDYNSLKIVAQSMAEAKSADPQKLAEHLRKGAKFDVMKAREAYFRPYDNQMVMEMYAVRAKEPARMKDQWDIYDALGTVPGPSEDMEIIAPPKDGTCKIG